MKDVFGNELTLKDKVFVVDSYKEIDAGRVIGFTKTLVKVELFGGRGVKNITSKKIALKSTSFAGYRYK